MVTGVFPPAIRRSEHLFLTHPYDYQIYGYIWFPSTLIQLLLLQAINKLGLAASGRCATLALLLSGATFFSAHAQAVVSTVAGSGAAGSLDGPALNAEFNQPYGVAVDAQGTAYVADSFNHVIRKITAAGVVSTLAGRGSAGYSDNPYGPLAAFNRPYNVLLTAQGNLLVADTGNDCIRLITPAGAVSTCAGASPGGYLDGPAATARFLGPIGLAQDPAGNVYVAEAGNYRIRRIDPAGTVTTLAGSGVRGFLDGPAGNARFSEPQGLALDAAGNLYIADRAANRIRLLSPAGVVSTYAGSGVVSFLDGPAATARFNAPTGVAVDSRGDVYVSDRDNQRLRRIEAATGLVSTVAGTGAAGSQDGAALGAQFNRPYGIAVRNGSLYVADASNNRIRRVAGLPLGTQARAGAAPLALEVFPNPLAGQGTLRYLLPRASRVNLGIFDVLGRRVAAPLTDVAQPAGPHEARLAPGSLSPGLYVARLEANG